MKPRKTLTNSRYVHSESLSLRLRSAFVYGRSGDASDLGVPGFWPTSSNRLCSYLAPTQPGCGTFSCSSRNRFRSVEVEQRLQAITRANSRFQAGAFTRRLIL